MKKISVLLLLIFCGCGEVKSPAEIQEQEFKRAENMVPKNFKVEKRLSCSQSDAFMLRSVTLTISSEIEGKNRKYLFITQGSKIIHLSEIKD